MKRAVTFSLVPTIRQKSPFRMYNPEVWLEPPEYLWFVGSMRLSAISVSAVALLVVLFLQAPNRAQSLEPGRIDVSKLGPQVGGRVPDFSLKDQNGKAQTLHSIMGAKGVMLVFVRSADW